QSRRRRDRAPRRSGRPCCGRSRRRDSPTWHARARRPRHRAAPPPRPLSLTLIWTRTLVALLLAAVLTTSARALDFTPCTEQGHEALDCATLLVPIDRDGTVPGTIGLHVERLRGQPPDLPVLVALAGGPGQSATSVPWDRALTTVRDTVQLVVFDQRGTGLSG